MRLPAKQTGAAAAAETSTPSSKAAASGAWVALLQLMCMHGCMTAYAPHWRRRSHPCQCARCAPSASAQTRRARLRARRQRSPAPGGAPPRWLGVQAGAESPAPFHRSRDW
eukprot:365252-Chlamydomonas_euryale.AAC.23